MDYRQRRIAELLTRGLAWLCISLLLGQLFLVLWTAATWMASNETAQAQGLVPTMNHDEPSPRSLAVGEAWTQNHMDVTFQNSE